MNKAELTGISSALKMVMDKIQLALKESIHGQNVRLLAVSKTKPIDILMEAYNAGVRHFGENYVEELVEKSKLMPLDVNWHFIGHLQSNKVKIVSIPNLTCIETVDSAKLAEKLEKACIKHNRDQLKIFLQVKTSDEDTKSGVEQTDLPELVDFIIQSCPHLVFSGLMTIGKEGDLEAFVTLARLRDQICEKFKLDSKSIELSMGMSGDFEQAIKYGSTNVRVGSLIFGARDYSKKQIDYEKVAYIRVHDHDKLCNSRHFS